jgi:hypothetical protein
LALDHLRAIRADVADHQSATVSADSLQLSAMGQQLCAVDWRQPSMAAKRPLRPIAHQTHQAWNVEYTERRLEVYDKHLSAACSRR